MTKIIIEFHSKRASKSELSGGKGAGLALLVRYGYPVPAGCIISVQVFKDFMQYNNISIANYLKLSENEINNLRESILKSDFPDNIYSGIVKAFAKLNKPVAVRSSMVGEDSLLASCAGQLDTYLDIESIEDLILSIKNCYASILNKRLIAYIKGSPSSNSFFEPAMAVVLQEMVDPKAAGVAFSADPISGQRDVIIEAISGSGKRLVDGKADPDRYRIDARSVISEYAPAEKGNAVLGESQILKLNKYITTLASKMKIPVDVEWAFDSNEIYLLQVRPITALAGKHIYSNHLVSDMSPGLIKPLLWSSNVHSMAVNVFGRLFNNLIGPNNYNFSMLSKRIHSRNYTDMTLMGELLERVGLPSNFMGVIARDEKSSRPVIRFTPRMLTSVARVVPFFLRYSHSAKEMKRFIRVHIIKLEGYKKSDWHGKTNQELLDSIKNLMEIHGLTQWYVVVVGINMMVRNRLLAKFVKLHAPDIVAQDLLQGLVGLKVLEPNQKINEMALEAVNLGEDTLLALFSGDVRAIEKKLNSTKSGSKLQLMMQEFMEMYGFLSANGTDFSAIPWCEDPGFVWKSIARRAKESVQPNSMPINERRLISQEALISQLNVYNKVKIRRKLRTLTKYIDLREKISMLMSEDAYQMRRLILTLADSLYQQRVIKERDDIFFLFITEISDLVKGNLDKGKIQDLIGERKAEYERDFDVEPSDTICDDLITYKSMAGFEKQKYLVGICGSPGLAMGRARVVFEPSHAPDNISKNDILIVPFTDAGWTPLFTSIGGVVAETGGQLSHTSIIAREYGLPAIVSVKNATTIIKDGQIITINAHEGKVFLN